MERKVQLHVNLPILDLFQDYTIIDQAQLHILFE